MADQNAYGTVSPTGFDRLARFKGGDFYPRSRDNRAKDAITDLTTFRKSVLELQTASVRFTSISGDYPQEEISHVLNSAWFSDRGDFTFSLVARSSGFGKDASSKATTDSRSEMVSGRVYGWRAVEACCSWS